MPRDGSNIYHRPAGTDAVTDTTIESSKYNALVADLEQDANLPRPIVAGGTGATSALTAMIALSGEVAKQGPVTNFDSFPWVNGSFWCNGGATGAPNASNFTGIYYEHSNTQFATIEAREITGNVGAKYVRMKSAGVWGSWVVDPSTADVALKVAKAGDTMSGDLTISKATPTLTISKTAVAQNNGLSGSLNGVGRWFVSLGNGNTESGGNAGSDFSIYRYTDAGAFIAEAFSLNRASGTASFAAGVQVNGAVISAQTATTGTYYFGNSGTRYLTWDNIRFTLNGELSINNDVRVGSGTASGAVYLGSSGTKYLQFDGTNFVFQGAQLVVNNNLFVATGIGTNGSITSSQSATTGTYYFGNSGTKYLTFDGSNYTLNGGGIFSVNGNIAATGNITSNSAGLIASGYVGTGNPYLVNVLTGNPNYGNILLQTLHFSGVWAGWNMDVAGSAAYSFRHDGVTTKNIGSSTWTVTSDARIKTELGAYTSGLDAVCSLRPINFRYKDNRAAPSAEPREPDPLREKVLATKYIGLIAQEAEKTMPELILSEAGYIDGIEVKDLRSADYGPLVFALVNAVKELKDRLEVLEAA